METLEYVFVPGFRRRAEWEEALRSALVQFTDAVGLTANDEVRDRLLSVPDEIADLVYAQCLSRIDLHFSDVCCSIQCRYMPASEEEESLDFEVLGHVEWQIDKLLVRLIVDDVEYAECLLGERLAESSGPHFERAIALNGMSDAETQDATTENETNRDEEEGTDQSAGNHLPESTRLPLPS